MNVFKLILSVLAIPLFIALVFLGLRYEHQLEVERTSSLRTYELYNMDGDQVLGIIEADTTVIYNINQSLEQTDSPYKFK